MPISVMFSQKTTIDYKTNVNVIGNDPFQDKCFYLNLFDFRIFVFITKCNHAYNYPPPFFKNCFCNESRSMAPFQRDLQCITRRKESAKC